MQARLEAKIAGFACMSPSIICGCRRWPSAKAQSEISEPNPHRARNRQPQIIDDGMQPKPAIFALSRACIARGTGSSNPSPSSRQSVSRGISLSRSEKPAVAAACAGPARRHGRQRRVGRVNTTPTADNVSARRYSSTAVQARRFCTWLHCCAKRGRISDVTKLSVRCGRQSQARSVARARSAADVSAPEACLRSDRAADGRRGWLR